MLIKRDKEELQNFDNIIGCDEVGRGPLAGPVNACAVRFDNTSLALLDKLQDLNITDSKKLSTKKRQCILKELNIDVSELILDRCYKNSSLGESFIFCVSEHDHQEIDKLNILQASLSAMKKASDLIKDDSSKILIDGNKVFSSTVETEAVIKGDSKILAIAMASIIAKEYRDIKMKEYDLLYPGYQLGKHSGYPTKEHRDAIKRLGPSEIHRKTFKGVKEFC